MARKAFLLGGTGKTGRALAKQLLASGWEVRVGSRGVTAVPDELEGLHVALDRADTGSLRDVLGDGVDAFIDFAAFEPEHAHQLLSLEGLARSLVVLSTAAVYADANGRSLDDIREGETAAFRVPLLETSPTVPPGDSTYATKKVAIERALLAQRRIPATVIRAGAIYGPGDRSSREWYFVKRVLDGRRLVVLAHRGESRFHPVSVENLAELIRLAAERPGTRLVNCGDPEPPRVVEIGRIISGLLDHDWAEVLVQGWPPDGTIGDNPWGVPRPFVLDMSEAEFEVGYRPVATYATAVEATCKWLVDATRETDWREVLPLTAERYTFDYDAEDAYVRGLTGG